MSDHPNDPQPDPTPPSRPEAGGGIDFTRYLPQRSFGLKLILVCALALLMAIPAGMIWQLAYSRSNEANNAIFEVAALSGGPQTLMGPALVVPYQIDMVVEGKMHVATHRLVLYAETGEANARLGAETRRRGLHDVPVYVVDADFTASFNPARLAAEAPAGARIQWADGRIFLALGDLRGAREATVTFAGREVEIAPAEQSFGDGQWTPTGAQRLVGGPVPWLAETQDAPVGATARLRIGGAERIALAAFARDTTITLAGDWPSPSFNGGALPDERDVRDDGFTAIWRIPFLARGAPGVGSDLSFDTVIASAPGATLLDLGNPYQGVERALKYSPMFIGLVFLTYFLFETTSNVRAHPAQYVLVGLAQCVFYLLLLSVSEIAGFTPGFLAAATATVLALSFYAGAVFGSRAAAIRALGVFSILYALIYVLMRMEDYALLVGSIASFLAIAGTMWMTRKLDWYGVMKRQS